MYTKKSQHVQERNDLIVEFLMQHKGRTNVVSGKEIRRFLKNKGYTVATYSLTVYIRDLMYERNLPICYVPSRGYYIGVTNEDIELVIVDLNKRIQGELKHIYHLNKFIQKPTRRGNRDDNT